MFVFVQGPKDFPIEMRVQCEKKLQIWQLLTHATHADEFIPLQYRSLPLGWSRMQRQGKCRKDGRVRCRQCRQDQKRLADAVTGNETHQPQV